MSPTRKARSSLGAVDPCLARAHKGYVDAINSNKTARVMAMLDENAIIMAPNMKGVSGTKNLRVWVDGYFKAFKTHWTKTVLEMVDAGAWGYDRSSDTSVDTPIGGGKPIKDTGKGILIYRRQPDGEFKVYRDIWCTDLPLPAAPKPAKTAKPAKRPKRHK
jgi:ketosteroid isomerase-like protein